MSPAFDTELLVRIEEAGVNASAPPEQLWIDGWLVRFSPGKAKRARCIQAVAPGRFPLQARLQRCLDVYAAAGLPAYVRITPFSQPGELDQHLADSGMERIDDTRVMVAPLPLANVDAARPGAPGDLRFAATDAEAFARWIGAQRGSAEEEKAAQAKRLRSAPVPHHAVFAVDPEGVVIAGGQVAAEDDLAGLYDIFTTVPARRRGVAEALCRHLLALAPVRSARFAYLQVDASNEPARRMYRRLGFEDAYAYHYRLLAAR
jgi:GNAT superfamily N-acetyltransferase